MLEALVLGAGLILNSQNAYASAIAAPNSVTRVAEPSSVSESAKPWCEEIKPGMYAVKDDIFDVSFGSMGASDLEGVYVPAYPPFYPIKEALKLKGYSDDVADDVQSLARKHGAILLRQSSSQDSALQLHEAAHRAYDLNLTQEEKFALIDFWGILNKETRLIVDRKKDSKYGKTLNDQAFNTTASEFCANLVSPLGPKETRRLFSELRESLPKFSKINPKCYEAYVKLENLAKESLK